MENEKFETLNNEQKELVKYWIEKFLGNAFKTTETKAFIEKHLTPEPGIEVGKWYITTDKEGNEYLFNHQDRGSSYGFFKGNWISENWFTGDGWPNTPRQATPEKVKQRLIEEAKRRYKREDTISYRNRGKAKIVGDIYFADECGIVAVLTDSKSTNPFYPLMDNGEWAEIIDEKREIEDEIDFITHRLEQLKTKL